MSEHPPIGVQQPPTPRTLRFTSRRSRLVAVAALTVLAVLGPFPAAPAGATPPTGDDFADAIDLSTQAIPDFPATTSITVDLTDTTWQADEPGAGRGPADTGSLWLRYTSVGFTGQLGYRADGFKVDPWISGSPDTRDPGSNVPSEQPAQLATLAPAPGNTTQVWGTTGFRQTLSFVRVEPGDTVWFQLYREAGSDPTATTFEIFRAPLLNDTVDEANVFAGVFNTLLCCDTGIGFDGSLHQATPDAGTGPGDIWYTFRTTGTIDLFLQSLGSWKPSDRPFTARLYRAPTDAIVTSLSALGAPVFSSASGAKQVFEFIDGSFVPFDQHWVEKPGIPLSPGRYYLQVEAGAAGGTFLEGLIVGRGPDPGAPPPNSAPAARPDTLAVPHGGQATVDLLGNDSDPDNDTLTVTSVTRTATGTAPGTLACTGGSCTYTATAGASGTDTFSYAISDGRGGTATSTLTVTVAPPPNRPPVTAPDTLAVVGTNGASGSVNVLTNDADPDGDPLTLVGQPTQPGTTARGALNCTAAGVCTWQSVGTSQGTAVFTYTVSDGRGGTATGTLTLTVAPPPPSVDRVSVRLTGARTYSGDGLVTGNVNVTRALGQLTGVTGAGTVATTPGGPLATVTFDVRRVLLFDLWFGSVTVTNPSTGLSVTTPVNSAPSVARDGTVSGNTNWFTTGTFPNLIQNYRLSWSVLDRS
jgi:hypothetical protein